MWGVFAALSQIGMAAAIFSPTIRTCSSSDNLLADPDLRVNISQAWAQIVPADLARQRGLTGSSDGAVLRINLVGTTGAGIAGFDNATDKLATLFQTTTDPSANVWTAATFACDSLYSAADNNTSGIGSNTTCPLPPGPLAINLSVPLGERHPENAYGLAQLHTDIRLVDASVPAKQLECLSLDLFPYYPSAWYYDAILWFPAAIAIGYWVASWAARFAAGYVVGAGTGSSLDVDARVGLSSSASSSAQTANRRKWGTMIVSGISGERLGVSGGLVRFITPGFRDVIWHLQFVAVLAMTAVKWPLFVYPIVAQTAWASLVWGESPHF